MTIYKEDLNFFLNCFSTDLDEVESIWRDEGGFVPIRDLAKKIVQRKGYSQESTQKILDIVNRSFPKDFRSGAFERQNFFYGLADHYAETQDELTYLVEFDVGNCNGTDKYVGNPTLLKIIRYMRSTFEQVLKDQGASYVEAFDNAKNDDLKFIVTGLSSEELTRALETAQDIVFNKFLSASDIPHSKYTDGSRNGVGVGSGFVRLGKGRSPQLIQERLNLFVEKRKLEDAQRRFETRKNVEALQEKPSLKSLMTPDFVKGVLNKIFDESGCTTPEEVLGFPYSLENVAHITNPFEARQEACNKIAEEIQMTAVEKEAFAGILSFYHSSEALTGAQRSNFLIDDIAWVRDQDKDPVTVLNLKVENCAGINKVLSHIHSAEMTKDFVKIVSEFCRDNFGDEASELIYYVGRNTFNIIIPTCEPEFAERHTAQYLQDELDAKINDCLCGEYFGRFGLDVPENMKDKKVGSIQNLRGLNSGVSVINIEARDSAEFTDEAKLLEFQNDCISKHNYAIPSSPITLPQGLTYRDLETGRTPEEMLQLLRVLAEQTINREKSEESNDNTSIVVDFVSRQKRVI